MSLNYTKEKTEITFKKDPITKIDNKLSNAYDISTVSNKLVIIRMNDYNCFNEIKQFICECIKKDEDNPILLQEKYIVTFDEEEEACDAMESLFFTKISFPVFNVDNIHFYTEKTYLYSVEMDYRYGKDIQIEIGTCLDDTFSQIPCIIEESEQIFHEIFRGLGEVCLDVSC
ncbi:MAG: hypothetical protein ACI4DX_06025 [Oliverpabstia sp.]